jgi:hypothetical protein
MAKLTPIMLFQPPALGHLKKHPRALLHYNYVCPTYDMQRRCRIIRGEEWVTQRVQELEAGDGHTEFPIQNIQGQLNEIIMSRTGVGVAVHRLPGMVGIGGDVPANSTNIHFESVTKLGKDPQAPKLQQQKPLLDCKSRKFPMKFRVPFTQYKNPPKTKNSLSKTKEISNPNQKSESDRKNSHHTSPPSTHLSNT